MDLQKVGCGVHGLIRFDWSREGGGNCECGNELWGSRKCGDFLG